MLELLRSGDGARINLTGRPWQKVVAAAPDHVREKLVGAGLQSCHLEIQQHQRSLGFSFQFCFGLHVLFPLSDDFFLTMLFADYLLVVCPNRLRLSCCLSQEALLPLHSGGRQRCAIPTRWCHATGQDGIFEVNTRCFEPDQNIYVWPWTNSSPSVWLGWRWRK